MTKENLSIDQNGSTIKYSAEGPNIDDLEFEEEDVVVNPAKTFEKLVKHLDSNQLQKKNTQKPVKIKKDKKKKRNKRPVSILLYWDFPVKKYKLFGELVRINYTNKNSFNFNIGLTINAKTSSIMSYIEKTINNTVYCNKISVFLNRDSKPFVFAYSKKKSHYRWSVREFVVGATNGEFTEIKINIS
jgi:hypothetical protein